MKGIKLLALSGVGALLLAAAPTQAEGIVIPIDISNVSSHDALGAPGNTVLLIDLGAALGTPGAKVVMNGIGWDLVLTTIGASWLNEAVMYFDDNIAPDGTGLHLTPGFADGFADPGVPHNYVGDIIKLVPNGIDNIQLPDGILRIEFYESFDDVAGADDAVWKSGTLFIQVIPAPGVLAMLGLAGLFGAPRRRRT